VQLCKDAYTVLRDNARLLIALFAMMLATNIPEVCVCVCVSLCLCAYMYQ
jgi:hypothetical protein